MKKYLIEKLKALFVGRSLIRYEVMSLMAHVDYQEEKLKQAQDEVGIFKTMTYNVLWLCVRWGFPELKPIDSTNFNLSTNDYR